MKIRLKDTTGSATFNRWKQKRSGQAGEILLALGQAIDPDREDVRIVFLENDGGCPADVRVLGEFRLDADQCNGASCWDRCRVRSGTDDDTCRLKDSLELTSSPDGIARARIVERDDRVRFGFSGKTRAEILAPLGDRVRVCVQIGDETATDLLQCTLKSDGITLRCESID